MRILPPVEEEMRRVVRDAREGLIEADRTRIEERMNFTRDNYRLMREALFKIIY